MKLTAPPPHEWKIDIFVTHKMIHFAVSRALAPESTRTMKLKIDILQLAMVVIEMSTVIVECAVKLSK